MLVNEVEQASDAVGRDVPAGVAHAEPANAQLKSALIHLNDVFWLGTGGVLGHEHHRDVLFNRETDRTFHGVEQLLHGPIFGVHADGARAEEGRGLDVHAVLGLKVNQGFDVRHDRAHSTSGLNGVIVLADVTEHRVDVVDVERTRSGEAKIDPLQAKLLHVIEQFLLLFDRGVQR